MTLRVHRRLAWFSSFYIRIAITFVLFVVVLLLGQSLVVSYLLSRSDDAFLPRNPNAIATGIAAAVGSALSRNPSVDVEAVVRAAYAGASQPAFVVMADGTVVSSSDAAIPKAVQRQAQASLASQPFEADPNDRTPPIVTAPIQVDRALAGMVMVPPPAQRGLFGDVGRIVSLPGTLVLLLVTVVATLVIFGPARRRLRDLERAAEELGSGRLEARASEAGHDEIARVARAFNRMAAELATRDEALRAADRQRRQMLADVSHELRTPLTTMRGYLDTLHMPDVRLDETTRDRYVDTIRHEAIRLQRIVLDLLDLAKFEGGGASFEPRVVAIDRVLEHVVRRHERAAQELGIRVETHVDDAANQIVADPVRLEQAIDNLVSNAIRHTPTGGAIELIAAGAADGCRISVVDSGSGIAPEHLAHVFDRFYKVDASRAAGSGGSGLGLSIVKAIVERHGGTVTVRSRPGRTEFIVSLPQGAGVTTSGAGLGL